MSSRGEPDYKRAVGGPTWCVRCVSAAALWPAFSGRAGTTPTATALGAVPSATNPTMKRPSAADAQPSESGKLLPFAPTARTDRMARGRYLPAFRHGPDERTPDATGSKGEARFVWVAGTSPRGLLGSGLASGRDCRTHPGKKSSQGPREGDRACAGLILAADHDSSSSQEGGRPVALLTGDCVLQNPKADQDFFDPPSGVSPLRDLHRDQPERVCRGRGSSRGGAVNPHG